MKKAYKVLSVLVIAVMILAISSNVFAVSIDSIKSNATLSGGLGTELTNAGSQVFTIITSVGMILAVVMMAIMGIKYMMESSEGKAEYKKNMMPYLVGAICVFGASTIAKIVVGFGQNL